MLLEINSFYLSTTNPNRVENKSMFPSWNQTLHIQLCANVYYPFFLCAGLFTDVF